MRLEEGSEMCPLVQLNYCIKKDERRARRGGGREENETNTSRTRRGRNEVDKRTTRGRDEELTKPRGLLEDY